MKAIFDWIKNSWVGTKLYEIWRMFYNDKTGVSMRKIMAFKFSMLLCYLIVKYTDKTNVQFMVVEITLFILTLMGIVIYDNFKTKKLENETK